MAWKERARRGAVDTSRWGDGGSDGRRRAEAPACIAFHSVAPVRLLATSFASADSTCARISRIAQKVAVSDAPWTSAFRHMRHRGPQRLLRKGHYVTTQHEYFQSVRGHYRR